jgi:hypothetical protein
VGDARQALTLTSALRTAKRLQKTHSYLSATIGSTFMARRAGT